MLEMVVVLALTAWVWGCSSNPTLVSAPPLPSATTAVPLATIAATAPKPTAQEATPIATPPPPSIAQLLANPPPAPVTPSRTCPKLPKPAQNIHLPGKGSAVVVTVMDYLSLAPMANVRVNVFHGDVCMRDAGCKPSHPHHDEQLKMTGKTDTQGRIVFAVPDLDYAVVIPEEPVPSHLPFSSDYNMGQQKCHELSHERRSVNGRALIFDGYLVPETMLAIRTQEDAIAGAMQLEELVSWLRDHKNISMTVRGGGHSWEVGFGEVNRFKRLVLVNGFNGAASMLGRWD